MCLFSVIMPVYNAVAYLEDAVNSIRDQTYRNFELILVDDGSTDGSAVKCDWFAQQDNRIKVVHIPNSGISNARNVGMKMAKGDYLAFCDHDDKYSDVLMETVRQYVETHDYPNVLKCTARQINVWGTRSVRQNDLPDRLITVRELVSDYTLLLRFERYIWDGFYKRSFIEQNMLLFDRTLTKGGEDCYFNIELFEKVDSIISIGRCLYTHYYRVGQSTSTKYDATNFYMYIKVAQKEYLLLKRFDLEYKTFTNAIIMQKARFVIAVASDCIYKTGCSLSKQEITDKIKKSKDMIPAFKHQDTLRTFIYLFRKRFKWFILYSFFSFHQIWLMYFIMRWNQQLHYKTWQ